MVLLWAKLNPIHPRILCAKIGWNWPRCSGEDFLLISSMYLRYFVIISPWKRAGLFIWKKLNHLQLRILCAKIGWNWPRCSGEKIFFINFVYVFTQFRNYLPLEKGWALHLKKSWIAFNQGFFVQSLVEIGSVVLEKICKFC